MQQIQLDEEAYITEHYLTEPCQSIGRALRCPTSILKRHFYTHFLYPMTIIGNSVGFIFITTVTVKAHAESDSGTPYYILLLLFLKESKHISVLAKIMDTVKAYVHLPKNVLLCHTGKIINRGNAQPLGMGEKVCMCNPRIAFTVLGKGKQIAICDTVF